MTNKQLTAGSIDPVDGSFVPDENTPSFPPIDDAIKYVQDVDWADVRQRCRKGLNNVGLFIAVAAEKVHDFGVWLAKV